MQVKGIKRGQNIELLETVDLPDGAVCIEIVPEASVTLWWQSLEKIRQEIELTGNGINSDEFLKGIRDRQPGRDVEL